MLEVADLAHVLTDAALVHLSAMWPLIAAGAAAVAAAVVASVAWLYYGELRSRRTNRVVTRPSSQYR